MYLESIREYWDTRAKGYSEKSVTELCSQSADFWINRLEQHLPKGKVLNCLDMGCGPGFIGILLGKMGNNITFCDYSENMIEEAKKNATKAGINFCVKRGDAQNPDFDDSTFDVIVSRNLVWNLEEPETAYKEWLRILKEKGKLIVFDGNHYLHQYNEKYLERKKSAQYKDPHTKEYMKNVDPKIMCNIAKNLPLSRFERPHWDVDFFVKNKATSVYAEPVWKDFLDSSNNKKSIIDEFVICVEK